MQGNSITKLFLLSNCLILSPLIPSFFSLSACYSKMNLLASSVPQRALEKLGRVAVKFVFLIQKEALQVLFSSHKI